MAGVPKRKPILGLIGGVGSGKSTVAQQMATLGARVLDADRIGHEMLLRDEVKQAARQRWGEGIFGVAGDIDRRKLARIVFSARPEGAGERKYLEQLVHPLIGADLQRRLEAAQSDAGVRFIVVDAALLVEAGWDRACDHVVFVEADPAQRLQRTQAKRGWTAEEILAREQAQESLTIKRKRADYVLDNSGSLEHTLQQVERFLSLVTDLPRYSDP